MALSSREFKENLKKPGIVFYNIPVIVDGKQYTAVADIVNKYLMLDNGKIYRIYQLEYYKRGFTFFIEYTSAISRKNITYIYHGMKELQMRLS